MDDVKQRLELYLDTVGVSKSEFGRKVGVSSAFVSSIRKSIQPDKIKRIADSYPDLDIGWLMTGDGSMLRTFQSSPAVTASAPHAVAAGHDVTVGQPQQATPTIDKALDEVAAQRRLVAKCQEQIDRLLSLLEKMQQKQ